MGNTSQRQSLNVKQSIGNQNIEIPTDPVVKERLMKYHRVDNDRDLKLEIYRDLLRQNRNNRGY